MPSDQYLKRAFDLLVPASNGTKDENTIMQEGPNRSVKRSRKSKAQRASEKKKKGLAISSASRETLDANEQLQRNIAMLQKLEKVSTSERRVRKKILAKLEEEAKSKKERRRDRKRGGTESSGPYTFPEFSDTDDE